MKNKNKNKKEETVQKKKALYRCAALALVQCIALDQLRGLVQLREEEGPLSLCRISFT
jgi:hypothetical protein